MSTATISTPNGTALAEPSFTSRMRSLVTAINLHFAALAALAIVVLYLLIHMIFVWQALSARDANAMYKQSVAMRSAQIAAQPLRGLDEKLLKSTEDADAFYATRLPYGYSEVAAELGVLTKKANVHLGQVHYTQAVVPGVSALTEVRIDAIISGDYRPVVQFINAIERDKQFFVINGINLTGQQTGQVNLRLRMTTYLRDPNVTEMNNESALPQDQTTKSAADTSTAPDSAGAPRKPATPKQTGAKR
jgi:type IV pilus assembly protein PilO